MPNLPRLQHKALRLPQQMIMHLINLIIGTLARRGLRHPSEAKSKSTPVVVESLEVTEQTGRRTPPLQTSNRKSGNWPDSLARTCSIKVNESSREKMNLLVIAVGAHFLTFASIEKYRREQWTHLALPPDVPHPPLCSTRVERERTIMHARLTWSPPNDSLLCCSHEIEDESLTETRLARAPCYTYRIFCYCTGLTVLMLRLTGHCCLSLTGCCCWGLTGICCSGLT